MRMRFGYAETRFTRFQAAYCLLLTQSILALQLRFAPQAAFYRHTRQPETLAQAQSYSFTPSSFQAAYSQQYHSTRLRICIHYLHRHL